MIKRSFDVFFSLLGLTILSGVIAALCIWVRKDSEGPIFYRGKRVGRGGKTFEMLKFRTMVINADKIGGSSTSDDDPRITRSGALMRRYKLDELPQLFNVLKGEMSFVGPRPQVEWAVALYSEEEKGLLRVRPGITDWASLKFNNEGEILRGSKDPDGDYLKLIAPLKTKLGLEYARKNTVFTDLKIIVATVLSIFGVDSKWALPEIAQGKITTVEEFYQSHNDLLKAA
jgi:lipopolysaccharide/colanic/teichoic acid biosynthesis glycosyltransferase